MDQEQDSTGRGSDRPDNSGNRNAGPPRFSRSSDRPRFTDDRNDDRRDARPARNDDRRPTGSGFSRPDSNARTAGPPRFGSGKPRNNDRPDRPYTPRPDSDRRPNGGSSNFGRPGNDSRNAGPSRFGRNTSDRRNDAPHRSNTTDRPRDDDRRDSGPRSSGPPAAGRFSRPADGNRNAGPPRFNKLDKGKPKRFSRDEPNDRPNTAPERGFDRPERDNDRHDTGLAEGASPRFNRPAFDRPASNRDESDRPKFDKYADRRESKPDRSGDNRPGNQPAFRPRPVSDNRDRPRRDETSDRPAFRPRPADSGDDRRRDEPRFPRRDNDRNAPDDRRNTGPVERNNPRFDRRDDTRKPDVDRQDSDPAQSDRPVDDRRATDRPRFERTDDRSDRPRFERGNDRADDRNQTERDPAERSPTRSERDNARRESNGRDRPSDRRDDSRSPFGRPPARPGNDRSSDRPERPARPSAGRRDDTAPPSRYSDEQRSDSRDRKVGRYDRAPDYDLERMQGRVPPRKRGEIGPKRERTFADDGLLRLNRYIANAGVCSRREADDLIARGDVSVNGKVITEMGYKVKPADIVRYGSRTLNPEKLVYVLLNKPKDYITTTDDPQERQTVMDLVADAGPYRLYPVGRLDRNTTGLLLLTNDGELADKLTHPSHQVKKIYQAEIDKPISEEHFQMLRDGFDLEDGPVKPDDVGIVTPDAQVIGIEIHSGRNRIVRRMFEHLGYDVTKLDRTVYASLTKKDLPRGKWRFLEPKEVVKLKYLQ